MIATAPAQPTHRHAKGRLKSRNPGANENHWIEQQYSPLPPLSREEEAWLIPMAQEGDEVATDRLIRANVKFAVTVALRYARKYRLDARDMVQAGVVGLWCSLEKFDPASGHKFITYAVWWVRQQLEEAVATLGCVVRRPQHTREVDRKFHQIRDRMEHASGQQVDDQDVLDELDPYRGYTRPVQVWSLDRDQDSQAASDPRNNPAKKTLHEKVPAVDGQAEVFAALSGEQLRARLNRYLDPEQWNPVGLQYRDMEILRRHFGWAGADPETLDQIGQAMGISRERVRQRKAKSLEAIKAHINGHKAEMMELVEG